MKTRKISNDDLLIARLEAITEALNNLNYTLQHVFNDIDHTALSTITSWKAECWLAYIASKECIEEAIKAEV